MAFDLKKFMNQKNNSAFANFGSGNVKEAVTGALKNPTVQSFLKDKFGTPTAEDSASVSIESEGYGGKATWEAVSENALKDPATAEASKIEPNLDALSESFQKSVSGIDLSADKMDELANQLSSGELSEGLAAQLRQMTSEKASTAGLFGQSAKALTARDIGKTSLDLQLQGAQVRGQSAALRESSAKLAESKRQYNLQYNLNVDAFANEVRNTNLRGVALEQERLQFNAKQNLLITQLMLDTVKAQQEIGYRYSSEDLDATGSMDAFQSYIDDLDAMLKG